jgi:alkaline phosphatase D
MHRTQLESILKRRASRRLATRATLLGMAGATFGLSLPGGPTRVFAWQASPSGTPDATPAPADVPLAGRASTEFGYYPFQLGVASGDPYPTSVVLWTRLAPNPIDGGGMDMIPYELRWELATDEGFASIVQSGKAVADPNLAHSVHVDVTGLEPATEYFYRFTVGSELSQTGRAKTAPAPGQQVDAVRFAEVSCSNYEHGYFTAYRDIAAQRPDFVTHLGDYIYEYKADDYLVRDDTNVRQHTGGETNTLVDYRNRYALYHTDPDLQAMRAAAPMIVTWDDHEVDNNWADEVSENNDPRSEFMARRADAFQAYYEHMPLRPSSFPVGPDMTLYRHLAYGDLLDLTVLDTRQYRTDHPAGDGQYARTPGATDPYATITGLDQERWLLETLSRSTSTWNVIAQQVIFAEGYFPDPDGGPDKYVNDWWSGYPEGRQRILNHLRDASVSNPVVLTGDVHASFANNLLQDFTDPESAVIGSEFVCTSVTSGGLEPSSWAEEIGGALPWVEFADGRHGGYTFNEITSDLWRADYYHVDNVEDPESGVSHIGTWVTESGNPGVQQG